MIELIRRKNKATVLRAIPIVATSDHYTFKTGATLAAGDVKVRIDGGSYTNIGSLPVEVGTTGTYDITLTAAETNGNEIVIAMIDAAGAEWDSQVIKINTWAGNMLLKSAAAETGKRTHNRTTGTVNDYNPDDDTESINSFTTELAGDVETRTPA